MLAFVIRQRCESRSPEWLHTAGAQWFRFAQLQTQIDDGVSSSDVTGYLQKMMNRAVAFFFDVTASVWHCSSFKIIFCWVVRWPRRRTKYYCAVNNFKD